MMKVLHCGLDGGLCDGHALPCLLLPARPSRPGNPAAAIASKRCVSRLCRQPALPQGCLHYGDMGRQVPGACVRLQGTWTVDQASDIMPALHLPASHSWVVDCCFPLTTCCALLNMLALLNSEGDGPVAHCRALASFRDVILQR